MSSRSNTITNINAGNNNNVNNESKSVNFNVTYIEKNQESFYKKDGNGTYFLKSTNMTTEQVFQKKNAKEGISGGNQTTKFINQHSL